MSSAKLCWQRWELSASFPQKLLQVGQFGSPAISSNASLHGQAQQCNTEGFQLKAGCQTAECSGGAETQPCSQRCCQGGNFPLLGGVHSCGQKSFMFPCCELPDLSLDCRSQPAPRVLVAESPCRHCTYHEVLWKCFPRERLLQTLWHGLHFHADLNQRPLGWKVRDLGNLALGQNLPLTLETPQVQL